MKHIVTTIKNCVILCVMLMILCISVNAQAGSVMGITFGDSGNDCLYTPDDEPLGGIEIGIFSPDGVKSIVTTDDNGSFSFTELPSGNYTVCVESLPEGWLLNGFGCQTIDIVDGETGTIDFCFIGENQIGCINAYAFNDVNENGIWDPDENPLEGVNCFLRDASNNVISVGLTDANGLCQFPNIPFGNYSVSVTNESGYFVTNLYSVSADINSTECYDAYRFGYTFGAPTEVEDDGDVLPTIITSSIWGNIFHDLNGNCIPDPDDLTLEGLEVFVVSPEGAKSSTFSDPNGEYHFENLEPGSYTVLIGEIPAGYYLSGSAEYTFELTPDEHQDNVDFCFLDDSGLSAICGQIIDEYYCVENFDITIAGVTVYLHDDFGNVIGITETDADGYFTFEDLSFGSYVVSYQSLPASDSPVYIESTECFSIVESVTCPIPVPGPGPDPEDGAGLDMGGIHGSILYDLNGDCIHQYDEEIGLEGVEILLIASDGTKQIAYSNNVGEYYFGNLSDGLYTVIVGETPQLYELNSLPNIAVYIADGEVVTDQNFCYHQVADIATAALCGYVFVDINCDAVFEGEDFITSSYSVSLLVNGTTLLASTTTDANSYFTFTDIPFDGVAEYSIMSYVDVPKPNDSYSGSTYYINQTIVLSEGDCSESDYFGACFIGEYAAGVEEEEEVISIDVPSGIWGNAFVDLDDDCLLHSTESGFAGLEVSLISPNGTKTITTTQEDGSYYFENLEPGQYSIIIGQTPEGYELASLPNINVFLDQNEQIVDQNFCYHIIEGAGSFCGYAYEGGLCNEGVSTNWILDDSEIKLYLDGILIATSVTDNDGYFVFENIPYDITSFFTIEVGGYFDDGYDFHTSEGEYVVEVNANGCDNPQDYNACITEAGANDPDDPEINPILGSLCGYVFVDENCDTVFEGEDYVTQSYQVALLNGTTVVQTTTSGLDGSFAFEDIDVNANNNYSIVSYLDVPNDEAGLTGATYYANYAVTIPEGPCSKSDYFGACFEAYYEPVVPVNPVLGSLCGYIFVDTNCDEIFEGEDYVTESYIVSLFDGTTLVETITAGLDGHFAFEDIDVNAETQYSITSYISVPDENTTEDDGTIYYANYEVVLSEGPCSKSDYFGACFDSVWGPEEEEDLIGSFCGYAFYSGSCNAGISTNAIASNIAINLISNGSIIATVTSDDNGYFVFDSIAYNSTSSFILVISGYYDDGVEGFFNYDGEYIVDVNAAGCDAPQNFNACTSDEGFYDDEPVDPIEEDSLGAVCGYIYLNESCNPNITLADSTWVGWQVSLLDENNEPVYVTFANDNGQFTFDNVEYGNYQVYYQGFSPDIYEITVDDEQCQNLDNYGLCILETDPGPEPEPDELASIWGNVFHDHTGDCLVDANETGFLGIEISLLTPDGTTIFTTTDVNGEFHFENIQPGIYTVTILSDPNGYYLTGQLMITVVLDVGDHADNVNFCYESIENFGGICGALGFSENCNETIDNYLEGVTVYLHNFTNSIISIQPTNANGEYEFIDLPAGYYSVSVDSPDENTALLNGTQQSFSISTGDCYQAAPFIYCDEEEVPVDPGSTEEETASIWGNVFHDLNDDCYVQTGEMGLAGIAVTLISPDGGEVTVFTDEFGAYHFEDLIPEEYTVYIGQIPDGYSLIETGTITVTLVAGQHQDHLNFCLHYADALGGICGSVLEDAGCDGNNDGGLFGVPVYLTDGSGDVLSIQTSGANGEYSFANLPLGNYTVYVGSNPAGYALNSIEEYAVTVVADECTDVGAFVYCQGGSGEPGELSSIWGNIFHDLNDDCIHQTNESGIGSVEITLFGDQGFKTSTFSAADGSYHFENIQPGLYTVFIGAAPDGYVLVGVASITVMLEPGEHQDNVDYCFVQESQMANICGYAFIDDDCNGLQGGSDQAFAEVLIYLHDENNTIIEVVSTNATGEFTFSNIPVGTYEVSIATGPAGYQISTNADVSVDLTTGDCNDVPAFGFCEDDEPPVTEPGSIWGFVFHDQNDNCLVDGDETGLHNVTITLSDANGDILATTTSSSTGDYHFENYEPGVYTVTVGTAPDGYVLDGSFTTTVIIGSGEHIDNINFCYEQVLEYGSICGIAFIDPNCDGSNDDATNGMQGATILLFNKYGEVINSTITDENGNYSFANLAVDFYAISVGNHPSGYTSSTSNQQSFDISADGCFEVNPLGFCEIVDEVEPELGSICGVVYYDSDSNGSLNNIEIGLSGITVYLYDEFSEFITATNTDANGNYCFHDLAPGNYQVGVATGPDGTLLTTDDVFPVTVGPGENIVEVVFGFGPENTGNGCFADVGTIANDGLPICEGGSIFVQNVNSGVIPLGFSKSYVLENGLTQEIIEINNTSAFTSLPIGLYFVYTVVYDGASINLNDYNSIATIRAFFNNNCGDVLEEGLPYIVHSCGDPCTNETVCGAENVCTESVNSLQLCPTFCSGVELVSLVGHSTFNCSLEDSGNGCFTYTPIDGLDVVGYDEVSIQGFDANGICYVYNYYISIGNCIGINCVASAAELQSTTNSICEGQTAFASITTLPSIPTGFTSVYILTDANGQLLQLENSSPQFANLAIGSYKVYNVVINTNDINLNQIGNISAINAMFIENGGTLCGSISSNPVSFNVAACCTANTGELGTSANTICLGGEISAMHITAPVVPVGFTEAFVLVDGNGNLQELNFSPSFTAYSLGDYYIYNIIANLDQFDLNQYTSIYELINITQTADFCLVVQANPVAFTVTDCTPIPTCANAVVGNLSATNFNVCVGGQISANHTTNSEVPTGYSELYVLADLNGNLLQLNTLPSFNGDLAGSYLIYNIIANTNEFNLNSFSTIASLVDYINGTDVCVSVQNSPAQVLVSDCTQPQPTCDNALVGEISTTSNTVCQGAQMIGYHTTNSVIPNEYTQMYLMTDLNGNLLQLNSTPIFNATNLGSYLVYNVIFNANVLDINAVSSIGALSNLSNDPNICLTIQSSPVQFTVTDCVPEPTCATVQAGALGIANPVLCSGAQLSAFQSIASIVPVDYEEVYVLTDNAGNVLETRSAPSFTTTAIGNYYIYNIITNTNIIGYGNISDILNYANAVNVCITVQSNPLQVQITDCTPPPAGCPPAQAGALGIDNPSVCPGTQLTTYKTSAAVIPTGYSEMFVLTDNAGNLLELNFSPSFIINTIGNYYIYNIIANTNNFDVNSYGNISGILSYANASNVCVTVQSNPLQVQITDCTPPPAGCLTAQVGTLGITNPTVCSNTQLTAYQATASTVPVGYEEVYVLTDNAGNVLETRSTPSFTTNAIGSYYIYNIITNTNIIGYGNISDILIYANAVNVCITIQSNPLQVQITDCTPPPTGCPEAQPCLLATSNAVVCLNSTISAYHTVVSVVPAGYNEMYILAELTGNIVTYAYEPNFPATIPGNYFVYNLVADMNQFNINNYGNISEIINYANAVDVCVAVQQSPVQIQVTDCTPPPTGCPEAQPCLLATSNAVVCLNSTISAYHTVVSVVPVGYNEIYILAELTGHIVTYAYEPNFPATATGNYFVYNLVADMNQFNINNYGNISEIINYANAVDVCVAVQQSPVQIQVTDCTTEPPVTTCTAVQAGYISSANSSICLGESFSIFHTTDSQIPTGLYEVYLITNLVGDLIDWSYEPVFAPTFGGVYYVYNAVLDVNTVDVNSYNTIFDLQSYANATNVCGSVQEIPFMIMVKDCAETGPPCLNNVVYECVGPVTPVILCPTFCDIGSDYTITATHTLFTCSITVLDDGCVRYTPLPGFIGDEEVVMTACNAQEQCETALAIVTVGECTSTTNTAPIVNDDNLSTTYNTPTHINVLANDIDAEGNELYLCNTANDFIAQNGTIAITNGGIIYTPNDGFFGTDSFTYTVCDGDGGVTTGTVNITVLGPGECNPNVNTCIEPFSSMENNNGAIICIDFCTPDAAITGYDSDFGCSIEIMNDFCIEYVPLPGFEGLHPITVTACNEFEQCETANVVIDVSDLCDGVITQNAPPVASDDNYETPGNTPIITEILINDNDPDNDEIEICAFSQPTSGAIASTSTSFVYTPMPGFVGTDSFTYTVCDPDGLQSTATAYVTVTGIDCVAEASYCVLPSNNGISHLDVCVDFCNDGMNVSFLSTTFDCGLGNIEGACFTYSPLPGFLGNDVIEVIGCNEFGFCETAFIYVDVTESCQGRTGESTDGISETSQDDLARIPEDAYRIANVFTPNGDGINEEIRIISANEYSRVDVDASIVIFNSLGQVVHTQEGPVQSIIWSGENNNTYLSEGTYYYQVEIKSPNESKPILLNGYIELRR